MVKEGFPCRIQAKSRSSNMLVSIAGGTVVYMLLVQLVF